MKKLLSKLIVLITILTVTETVYGQEVGLPKRIVLKGDSGVFFTKKQEIVLIEKLNSNKKLEFLKDSLTISNQLCKEELEKSSIENVVYRERQDEMVRMAVIQDSIITIQKDMLNSQEIKLQKWKKGTLCTGVVAVGCVFAGITGAWLPAVAVIAVTEAAIIFTKKKK